ncbi:transformer-2 protein homolog beta isoform X3 [Ictalurus furcatus]|uniref:transformer-2 protein homolog beta isoform X3 n=1 Tax=Ictalurus furcatus TaxID=66913 RepID=UPI0023502C59|nr:transformer-2 protein homolog beta isoform X3 [Ictalurus furcatus]
MTGIENMQLPGNFISSGFYPVSLSPGSLYLAPFVEFRAVIRLNGTTCLIPEVSYFISLYSSRSHRSSRRRYSHSRSCSRRRRSRSRCYSRDSRRRRSRSSSHSPMSNRRRHVGNRAKERANGMELDGRRIRVDFSITKRPHTPTPGIYMGRPTYGGGGHSLSRRHDYYDRGYDRYDDRDYYSRSYRRRSPSPYYSRGGYRSRSRSYSPRHY